MTSNVALAAMQDMLCAKLALTVRYPFHVALRLHSMEERALAAWPILAKQQSSQAGARPCF